MRRRDQTLRRFFIYYKENVMPLMHSLRNFRLASTSGHVVVFSAGKPTFVPDAAVQEAMKNGAAPVNADELPFFEEQGRAKVDFAGDARRSILHLAISEIVAENNIKEFDGSGSPSVTAVEKRVGFDVTKEEVVNVFREYHAFKSEGREYVLHPAAANILKIVRAEGKRDLLDLAAEFVTDFEANKANYTGLDAKALRKTLLVRLSGVAA
jgi:hypothetical protein